MRECILPTLFFPTRSQRDRFFIGNNVSSESAAYLSTLFDMGGIVGGILAGLISDYTGKSASTCALMLVTAVPMVRER